MRTYVKRVCAVVPISLALVAMGLAGAGASPVTRHAARSVPRVAEEATAGSGAQLWAKQYKGPINGNDVPSSMAVGSDGTKVFVTGQSSSAKSGQDYATVAYAAASGRQLWIKRYNGTGDFTDEATAVRVSPNGKTVFVTGFSDGAKQGSVDFATIAYKTANGSQLWVKRYGGRDNYAQASALAVSPGGKTVYVTGYTGPNSLADYATVAYNAATGAQKWVKTYAGPSGADQARSISISHDGRSIYVTGESLGSGAAKLDYATVSYSATGSRRWVKRYDGGHGSDAASSMSVDPRNGTVYVTGESMGSGSVDDYATVAYSATGTRLWVKRYSGPGNTGGTARAVTVSPSRKTVVVTGEAMAGAGNYATVAYTAATGAQKWARTYNGPGNSVDQANAIAVSSTGTRVYVTGESEGSGVSGIDYATVSYNTADGSRQWVKRYTSGGEFGQDQAFSVAVSHVGNRVFVTGESAANGGWDYGTEAYRG